MRPQDQKRSLLDGIRGPQHTHLDEHGDGHENGTRNRDTGLFNVYRVSCTRSSPSATVRFDVPEISRVELQVYDVTGKLVETLLNERMTAGQHQYTWQPQELATGTYFLRLITTNQTFTQKVTYVK